MLCNKPLNAVSYRLHCHIIGLDKRNQKMKAGEEEGTCARTGHLKKNGSSAERSSRPKSSELVCTELVVFKAAVSPMRQ